VFTSLIRSGDTKILNSTDADPEGCLRSYVNEDLSIYIKVVGLIDIKLEMERVAKRNTQLQGLKEKLEQKMNMKGYEKKVPEAVQKENLDKLKGYETEINQNIKGSEDLAKFI